MMGIVLATRKRCDLFHGNQLARQSGVRGGISLAAAGDLANLARSRAVTRLESGAFALPDVWAWRTVRAELGFDRYAAA